MEQKAKSWSFISKQSHGFVAFITYGHQIACSAALKWTHSPESLQVLSLELVLHHGSLIFLTDVETSFTALQPSDRYNRTVWTIWYLEGELVPLLVTFTVYWFIVSPCSWKVSPVLPNLHSPMACS